MAEQLDSFEFRGPGAPATSKYVQYLDGNIYRLVEGEDVTKASTVRARLAVLAKERGLRVRTQLVDGGIVIQAYKPGES